MRIVDMTNAARVEISLEELVVDRRLTVEAERYAEVMARQDWFDHVGPDSSTITDRAEDADYLAWEYLAENLARGAGPADPSDILAAWLSSPGHRDNILSPVLREIGVGCYMRSEPDGQFWCVQAFGTRRP